MELEGVARSNLAAVIADRLRELILTGQAKPGDRLPGHRALARTLRVSVPSVREAISALTAAGLLETRHGRGTYVSGPLQVSASAAAWLGPLANRIATHELVELHRVLERAIAGLAARRADDNQIQALQRAVAELERQLANPERYLDADREFHASIAVAAQNRVLLRASSTVRLLLTAESQPNPARGQALNGRARDVLAARVRLVQAIARHDVSLAELLADEIVTAATRSFEAEAQPRDAFAEEDVR